MGKEWVSRKGTLVRHPFMGCAPSWMRVAGRSLLVAFVVLLPACGGSSKSAGYPEAASAESEPYYGDRDGDGLSDSVDAYDMASEAPAPEPSSTVAENEQIQITGPLSGAPAVRKKRNSLFGQSDARRRSASSPNAPPPPPKMAKKPAPGSTEPAEPPIQSPAPDDEKRTDAGMRPMLIYKASLGLAVFKVQQNLDTIEKMAVDSGGYMVTRNENHIKVRVPAERFQETIDAIVTLGDVHHRQISADDVTAEFTDLEIRMKNAVVVRDRLQALLAQVKNVEEALEVERELRRLTEEIEVMKGRLKLLSELAAYSTIDVQFSERTTQIQARVRLPFPWLNTLGLEHLLNL